MPNSEVGILLPGLDGSNPLGFMAALGILQILSDWADSKDQVRMGWENFEGGWRPRIQGFRGDQEALCESLIEGICHGSSEVIEVGKEVNAKGKETHKFPFHFARFKEVLACQSRHSDSDARKLPSRRSLDFLAGFGTDAFPDSNSGDFQCTAFKMVRSGDSSGQGMLAYAKSLQSGLNMDQLFRTVFLAWDYRDESRSFRWDPLEDQRHALRGSDPSSKNSDSGGPGVMAAANRLAFEALRILPTVIAGRIGHTTGILVRSGRADSFVWPIWSPIVELGTVKSILSLGTVQEGSSKDRQLQAIGIRTVYRAEIIRPNQYYQNFLPAAPLQ